MALDEIAFSNLRNLKDNKISLGKLNHFYGKNGAGKTAILEAIYLLSFGRSMRSKSHHSRHIITHGESRLQVKGHASDNKSNFSLIVSDNKTQAYINEESVSIVHLSKSIPVRLFNYQSMQIIKYPEAQRKMLDWGVFHVKHEFLNAWKEYRHGIKQRNMALKTYSKKDLEVWSNALLVPALQITEYRIQHLESIRLKFKEILNLMETPSWLVAGIDIVFNAGWPCDKELCHVWDDSIIRDKKVGYTSYGPHRASLNLCMPEDHNKERRHVNDALSRGQQKLIIYALMIAQGLVVGEKCIYLFDDIFSELDIKHGRMLVDLISQVHPMSQVCITSLGMSDDGILDNAKTAYLEEGNIFY